MPVLAGGPGRCPRDDERGAPVPPRARREGGAGGARTLVEMTLRRVAPLIAIAIVAAGSAILGWASSVRPPSATDAAGASVAALAATGAASATAIPSLPARSAIPTWAASCPPYDPAPVEAGAIAELGPSASVPPSAVEGERFVLEGVLLSRQCDIRDREVIDVWHIDATGHYGPSDESGEFECCYFQARLTTDANGRFELHTIRPATEPTPGAELPAHIHLALVTAEGSDPDLGLVFGDDPTLPNSGPVGDVILDMERRSDADGEYWYSFVVLRI